MARYAIVGTRKGGEPSMCHFISRTGNVTTNAERLAVLRTLPEATAEVNYWNRNAAAYRWRIEQLPRGPVASAILRAKEVNDGCDA